MAKAEHGHTLSAGFGLILTGIAAISLLAAKNMPALGPVGVSTPLVVGVYAFGMRSLFLYEKRKIATFMADMANHLQYERYTMKDAVIRYGLNAAVIVCAALWLPVVADRLAVATGLGRSFVGSVLVAMTTSLPDLVVSITALRIGAADLAIANLLGSNMFNIFLLAIDDAALKEGPLLNAVSQNHALYGSDSARLHVRRRRRLRARPDSTARRRARATSSPRRCGRWTTPPRAPPS